jgi:hypothetical protein
MNKKSMWTTPYPLSKMEEKSSASIRLSTGLNELSRTEKISEQSRMQVLPTIYDFVTIYTSTLKRLTQTERFAFIAEERDIIHLTISDTNIKGNPLYVEKCDSTLIQPDIDDSITSFKPEQNIPFRDNLKPLTVALITRWFNKSILCHKPICHRRDKSLRKRSPYHESSRSDNNNNRNSLPHRHLDERWTMKNWTTILSTSVNPITPHEEKP